MTASFYTNGVLIDRDVLSELADAGLRFLCISEHTKGEAQRVRALIDDGGFPIEVRETFRPTRDAVHTWAGQTITRPATGPPHPSEGPGPCLFQRQDAAVVLWDGRVNVCCIDVEGHGVQGTVGDYLADPQRYRFRPIDLCASCGLMRGDEDLS